MRPRPGVLQYTFPQCTQVPYETSTSLKSFNVCWPSNPPILFLISEHSKRFTKYALQSLATSELFDPTYPGAHLSLNRRQSLTPRCTIPHPTLYPFPKAFLSKPEVLYGKPYKLRPCASEEGPNSAARACRCRFSRSIAASNFALPCALKASVGSRRLSDSLLRVARGSRNRGTGPKLVFRAEDVGADKWIVCCPNRVFPSCGAVWVCVLLTMGFSQIGCTVHCIVHHRDVLHAICGTA
jgi:hypothetical protein